MVKLIDGLEFENILQYVQIPARPFSTGATTSAKGASDAGDETSAADAGAGRQDFMCIFDKLHRKGVVKIIRLIVDDDSNCPHIDEVIEWLKHFEIEDWEWKKEDVSTIVLQKAAAHAKHVRLWSSGNHSVLRDWSSCDGLKGLKLVRFLRYHLHCSFGLQVYLPNDDSSRACMCASVDE